MSEPAVALTSLPFELVYSDGEPLETYWHVLQMNLLIDVIFQAMVERGRSDFFVGGDMFVYYSVEQARDVAIGRPYFRGPDVFYVGGAENPRRERKAWVAWEEGGRLPDVIIELLSPKTAKIDRTVKKDLYSRAFRTPEYFLYDRDRAKLEGFRLKRGTYQPLIRNARGRLESEQLGLELGEWHGRIRDLETTWLRLFHPDDRLAPTEAEAAQARAEAAEKELERLRAQLRGGTA
jgi:Uma2 family endonuclease